MVISCNVGNTLNERVLKGIIKWTQAKRRERDKEILRRVKVSLWRQEEISRRVKLSVRETFRVKVSIHETFRLRGSKA
jgi:hypothetical protein